MNEVHSTTLTLCSLQQWAHMTSHEKGQRND